MGVTFTNTSLVPGADMFGNGITGVETMPRETALSGQTLGTSGSMRLNYFTPQTSKTVSTAVMVCGGTAASATPTLIRIGIYSVASNGDITLVSSTANDTALFASTNSEVTKALSSSYTLLGGQRYAGGILVVTGGTLPTPAGSAPAAGSATLSRAPRRTGLVTGQTDLPSTVAAGSIVASGAIHWMAFV